MSTVRSLGAVPSPEDPRDHVLTAEIVQTALAGIALPRKYRATNLGPVLNQNGYPECVAYATKGMKQWQERRDDHGIVAFDPHMFYRWCKAIDGIPQDGTTGRAAMSVAKNRGYPVVRNAAIAKHYAIAGYWSVPVNDRDLMKAAIMAFGPILTCEEWPESWMHPVGGVVPAPSVALAGGHGTMRYGWDDDVRDGAWIVRQTWGKFAGSTNGNIWIPYRYESADGRAGTAQLWEAWKSKDVDNNP